MRLTDDVTPDQLEAIRPETAKLPSLETTGRVRGVILTIRWVSGVILLISLVIRNERGGYIYKDKLCTQYFVFLEN